MLYYPKGRYNQMNFKNIKKVMAGTVAGAIMVSAAACTPISTKAQWSYKEGKNEKAIGVYILLSTMLITRLRLMQKRLTVISQTKVSLI